MNLTDNQPRIPKTAVLTLDADAQAANSLHNDVTRMADIGRILRRVFIQRLHGNAAYMRKWITRHCNFSPASGLRYMLLDRHRTVLREIGCCKLADAYHALELDSQVSVNLQSPLWAQAAVPFPSSEEVPA